MNRFTVKTQLYRVVIVFGISLAALLPAAGDGEDGGRVSQSSGPASFNKARGFNGGVGAIAPAGDGSGDIYVGGGFTIYNGTASNCIIRLKADGTVDTAFNVGSGFGSGVVAIVLAGDGSGDI